MKKIDRSILKGQLLNTDCKNAHTTTHEYGKEDNRIFCYGLYREQSIDEIDPKCIKCKAYVMNAKPISEKISELY